MIKFVGKHEVTEDIPVFLKDYCALLLSHKQIDTAIFVRKHLVAESKPLIERDKCTSI